MRDISTKYNTKRTAKAVALVRANPLTIDAIKSGKVPKADPLAVARVAGIQAAKQTSNLIPYCHQVPLDFVDVEITLDKSTMSINSHVTAIWKTGVEMEALVAASTAALTLYDMLKIIDDEMEIVSVKLLEKKGGKSSLHETGDGLRAAVLVLSDSVSKGEKGDLSGKVLAERLREFKIKISHCKVLPDERDQIQTELISLADKQKLDLIVTTGGTGVGPRDNTVEATMAVIHRRLEGVEEAMRKYGQDRMPTSMLSRSVVGIRGTTLIINLPGSRGGVEDGVNALFPAVLHAFRMMRGDAH